MKLQHPLERLKVNMTQGFGGSKSSTKAFYEELGLKGHNGVDWGGNGRTVMAANDGEVESWVGADGDGYKGNRCMRVWDYSNNIMTFYCHLREFTVANGVIIKAGDKIAISNNTGKYTTGAHLHFGVYELTRSGNIKNYDNGYHGAVDPDPYLALELKDGDLIKCLGDPMVYIMKNGQKWWIKNEESFKNWFGYSVSKAKIIPIDNITRNYYPYGGAIGK